MGLRKAKKAKAKDIDERKRRSALKGRRAAFRKEKELAAKLRQALTGAPAEAGDAVAAAPARKRRKGEAHKWQQQPWSPRAFQRNVDRAQFAAQATSELERLFYTHKGRNIHKWHHFLEVYDRHISRLIAQRKRAGDTAPLRMLEIGVRHGGSLELWRNYLGPEAVIFGIDIDPNCANVAHSGCQVRIGSQDDPEFLAKVVEEMGGVDIVLDDGSHRASHQRASFEALFSKVAADGLYMCEDLITAYHSPLEGGLKRPGTYLEMVKDMIDWLHDWYITDEDRAKFDFKDAHGFARGVFGISIYDNIVVIEKRAKGKPFHTRIGRMRRAVEA